MKKGNEEVKKMVEDWFNVLQADFYDVSIWKLITQYNKCLNLHGDYVKI
jgi:hypothetical protein